MKLKSLLFPMVLLGLASCVWISQDEYEALADFDRDGFNLDEDCDDENDTIYPNSEYEVIGDDVDSDCDTYIDAICAERLQFVSDCDTTVCSLDDIAALQDYVDGNTPSIPQPPFISDVCAAGIGMM